MKRDYSDEDCVKTTVKGEELEFTKRRMIEYFKGLIFMKYRDDGYPRWNDSVRQLIENAWVLWKWHAITDPETGRRMTLKKTAYLLCRNLHVPLPVNISSVAHQSLHSGRLSVVDYYAMLYREGKVSIDNFVWWYKPPYFPKFKSCRGIFD